MPQRELKLYLWDIRGAGEDILRFTGNKEFTDYQQDAMLRAAVERKFEVIRICVVWWMIHRRSLLFVTV